MSAEEKARQEVERQKDFSPIPEKKKKTRNFKLSSAKKQDSDYDDVVSSVASPSASKNSMASPANSLGKIKMRQPAIDNSVTRIQDETTDNFKLRPEKVDDEHTERDKSAAHDASPTPKIALNSNRDFDAKAQTVSHRREEDLPYSPVEADTDRNRPKTN